MEYKAGGGRGSDLEQNWAGGPSGATLEKSHLVGTFLLFFQRPPRPEAAYRPSEMGTLSCSNMQLKPSLTSQRCCCQHFDRQGKHHSFGIVMEQPTLAETRVTICTHPAACQQRLVYF